MNNELYPTSFKVNQSFNRNSMPPSNDVCSTFKPMPIAQSNRSQISPASKDLLKQKQQLLQRQLVPNTTNKSFLNNNISNGRLKHIVSSTALQNNGKLTTNSNNNTAINNASNQIILNNKVNLRAKSPPPVPPQRYISQLSSNQYYAGDQPADASPSSVLWRSKSFASGLQQNLQQQDDSQANYVQQQKPKISLRQTPITYANPSVAAAQKNRNTIHLGKQLDDKLYGFNNNSNLSCNQNYCKGNQLDEQMFVKSKGNLNKVNDEISKRYLAAAENNFNASNGLNKMRHSTSHHSYLSSKAPTQQQANQFQTGTLPNSITYHGQLNGQLANQLNGQLNPKQHPGSLDASSLSSIGSSGSGSLTRSKFLL